MNSLMDKINSDLKSAMKEHKQLELSTLRMMLAALKNKRIELRGEDLNDDQVLAVIAGEIKKRKDSIQSYLSGNRQDLADQEQKEIDILQEYLPAQMSEAEVEKAVREVIDGIPDAGPAKFGQVMGAAMAKLKNQADGNVVKVMVEKMLGVGK